MSESETSTSSASSIRSMPLASEAEQDGVEKEPSQEAPGVATASLELSSNQNDKGLRVHWPPKDTPSSSSSPGLDIVIVHGLYGGSSEENPENTTNLGSGSSSWVQGYAESLSDLDCRILIFSYDANLVVTSDCSRLAIEKLSTQLLRELANSRENEPQKRSIMFVAYDIGCVVVKDTLATSAVSWTSKHEREIRDYTRILVFSGCPHRSRDKYDMQYKISQFIFTTSNQNTTQIRPQVASIKSLADAIIEINGLFWDSKTHLRSHLISIVADKSSPGNINNVFDSYTSAMGVPFEEITLADPDSSSLAKLKDDIILPTTELSSLELIFQSLATQTETSKTRPTPDDPVLTPGIYQEWLDSTSSQILFVKATDWYGDENEQIYYALEKKYPRDFVLYFSFDRWDRRRNSMKSMLETFMAQLICHWSSSIDSYAKLMFNELDQGRGWTELDLMNWLERSVYLVNTFFVVNNFDHCPKDAQKRIISFFCKLISGSEDKLKMAVISKEPPPSMDEVPFFIFTDRAVNKEDEAINSNKKTLASLIELRPVLLPLKDEIQRQWGNVDDVDSVVLDILCEQVKVTGQKSKDTFLGFDDKTEGRKDGTISPEGFLDRILRQIPNTDLVRRVLRWILHTTRPLTIWELATVMFIDSSQDEGSEAIITTLWLEECIVNWETWYAGIISIHQNEVRLSHPRLREIFMAPREKNAPQYLWNEIEETADLEIAKCCLQYLSRSGSRKIMKLFQNTPSSSIQASTFADRRNLCSYAITDWLYHCSRIPTSLNPLTLLEPSICPLWYKCYWAFSNPITRPDKPLDSLYLIFIGLGIPFITENLNDEDFDSALVEAARNARIGMCETLLRKKSFSPPVLLDTLRAAVSSGEEQLMLHIINHIATISQGSKVAWPVGLVYRAAFLGLDQFAKRLFDLGCAPEPGGPLQTKSDTIPFLLAARWGKVSTIRVFLENKANVSFADDFGRTCLAFSVVRRNPDNTRVLVEEGKAEVDHADKEGLTSLYLAICIGHYQIIQTLLQLGADPNKICDDSVPLIKAVTNGFMECVRALLEWDANPNITNPDSEFTPLTYAAIRGNLGICRLLISKGADMNAGASVLCAVVSGYVGVHPSSTQLDVIKFLVENSADINAKASNGLDALTNAIYEGSDLAVVEYLLEHGADANSTDSLHRSPLIFAAGQSVHRDKVNGFARVLLDHGADPNLRDLEGLTPLMFCSANNYSDMVQLLLEHPRTIADTKVEGTSDTGYTALSYATRNKYHDIIRLLADAGANLRHSDTDGLSPIQVVAYDEPIDSLRVLLEYRKRIDIDAKGLDGYTALSRVVTSHNIPLENVKALINAGADVNSTDNNGDPPISFCVTANRKDLVTLLLKESELDINLGGLKSGNALHRACTNSNPDMVKLLVEHGANVNLSCDTQGGSPIQCACLTWERENSSSIKDIISYLIANGANVAADGGRTGSVMSAAAFAAPLDAVQELLSAGGNVNAIDDMGCWPIQRATHNTMNVFKAYVKAGGDLTVRDKLNRTVLHFAALFGNAEVMEYLLEVMPPGAVEETDIDGWTPLCWAVRGETPYLVPFETTPDRLKVIELLLGKKADCFVRGTIGEEQYSVFKIAKYSNADQDIIALLKRGIRGEGTRRHSKDSPELRRVDSYKGIKPGRNAERFCDYCHWSIRGIVYVCTTCSEFDYCNKCYQHRDIVHPADKFPDHEFEAKGPEFDPTPTHSRKSSKSSSSSSSSGWGPDSDGEGANKEEDEEKKGDDSDNSDED